MMKRIKTLLVAMCVLIAFPGLVKAEDMADMTEMSLLRKSKQAIRQAKKKTKRTRKNNKKKLKKKSRAYKKKLRAYKKKKKNIIRHKKKRISKNSRKKKIKKTKRKAKKRTSKRSHKLKKKKKLSSRRAKGNKKKTSRRAASFDENYAAMMANFDANVAILKQDMTIFGDRATAEQFAPIILRELGFARDFCKYAVGQPHASRHRTSLEIILNDINSINNIHKMISVLKLERFRGTRGHYQNFVLLGNVIGWKLNDRRFRGLNGDRLLSSLLTESLNLMDRS